MRILGILALFSAALHGQDFKVKTLERSVIQQRFASLRSDESERAAALREMFAEAGCTGPNFKEQAVRGWKVPNMICTLPGTSTRTFVVTAHYDKVKKGEGAIDNWSGAAMLPSLYESLAGKRWGFTYTFILFTGEESGLVGSRYYVGELTLPQRRNIAADINIDSVGLAGYVHVWSSRANPDLRAAAASVASSLGIGLSSVDVESLNRRGGGDSDSHPFVDAKIPVIDFHSLTADTFPLLHSAKDVPSAVDATAYYDTYRLLAVYLGFLDSVFEP